MKKKLIGIATVVIAVSGGLYFLYSRQVVTTTLQDELSANVQVLFRDPFDPTVSSTSLASFTTDLLQNTPEVRQENKHYVASLKLEDKTLIPVTTNDQRTVAEGQEIPERQNYQGHIELIKTTTDPELIIKQGERKTVVKINGFNKHTTPINVPEQTSDRLDTVQPNFITAQITRYTKYSKLPTLKLTSHQPTNTKIAYSQFGFHNFIWTDKGYSEAQNLSPALLADNSSDPGERSNFWGFTNSVSVSAAGFAYTNYQEVPFHIALSEGSASSNRFIMMIGDRQAAVILRTPALYVAPLIKSENLALVYADQAYAFNIPEQQELIAVRFPGNSVNDPQDASRYLATTPAPPPASLGVGPVTPKVGVGVDPSPQTPRPPAKLVKVPFAKLPKQIQELKLIRLIDPRQFNVSGWITANVTYAD